MLVRCFDTETTGINEIDEPIQVAWVDCILENDKLLPIEGHEYLIYTDVPIGKDVPHRITPNAICQHGHSKEHVKKEWDKANTFENEEFIYLAHNADFDVNMLKKIDIIIPEDRVMCTYKDFPWKNATKLSYLCSDFGILIADAHQAMVDVSAMISLLNKQEIYSLEKFFSHLGKEPIYYISTLPFDKKDKAKEKGYTWNDSYKVYEKKFYEETDEAFEEWEKKIIDLNPVTLIAIVSFDEKELAKEKGYKWESTKKAWIKENFRMYEGYKLEKWERKQ